MANTHKVYAFSRVGASITMEVFASIGYTVLRKGNLNSIISNFNTIGMFYVNIDTKIAEFHVLEFVGVTKQIVEQELYSNKAFRASKFILKYQKS